MRLLLALILLLPLNTFAAIKGSPFPPAVDERFDDLENDNLKGPAIAKKYAKFVYEPAVHGGDSASTNALGVFLPAGALITGFYAYINTAFEGEGGGAKGGSVAIQCSGTRELMDYQDLETNYPIYYYIARALGHQSAIGYGASSLVHENQSGIVQGLGSSVSSSCEIKAVVRGNSGDEDLSVGKMSGWIEYLNFN